MDSGNNMNNSSKKRLESHSFAAVNDREQYLWCNTEGLSSMHEPRTIMIYFH